MKKLLKILLKGILCVLILVALFFVNAFMGNPVSHILATVSANSYLKENYADTDFEIDTVGYNLKYGNYFAKVKSPTSPDSYFRIEISMTGKVQRDSYEEMVLSGSNTARRINDEYRNLINEVFDSPDFPYVINMGFGNLAFVSREYAGKGIFPDYALIEEDFALDSKYDVKELGAQAGELVVYIDDETVTAERAAEIILDIKDRLDKAELPFRIINFTLQKPKNEDGTRPEESIYLLDVPYKDIYPDGMVDRVKAEHQKAVEYFAEQDAQKQYEIENNIG